MKLRDFFLLAGGIAAAPQVSALTLGHSDEKVLLGSPLDLTFHVQPDAGQTASSSCIRAEVWMGDAALGSNQVQVFPNEQSVRIRTTSAVYEPMISLRLTAGCEATFSRSYTFFADPPQTVAASAEPIDLSKIETAASVAAYPLPVSTEALPRPPRLAKRAVNRAAIAAIGNEVTVPADAESTEGTLSPAAHVQPPEAQETAAAQSAQPRLQLQAMPTWALRNPENRAVPAADALPAMADMYMTTRMQIDANEQRLEILEKQLLQMQSQLISTNSQIHTLNEQLVQAQNADLPLWMYATFSALGLALAAIGWLLWRLKKARQATRSWTEATLTAKPAASVTAGLPSNEDVPATATSTPDADWVHDALPAKTVTAQSAPAAPERIAERLAATPLPTPPSQTSPDFPAPPNAERARVDLAELLTSQALFDVREQADFYASIGENDQAIEILQSHIAQNQASSPQAYIELLQLVYRLGRTETFEQVRTQFERYFNVRVPDFMGFARKGHDLWSSRPDVLAQIEALWPTDEVQPLLLSLILAEPTAASSQTPSAAHTRFDLCAFDDLLMLHNVVKTTSATERGQMQARTRTAPLEVPLPEVMLQAPSAPSFASALPMPGFLGGRSTQDTAPVNTPLPLQEADLDMLTAEPAQTPLAPSASSNDSPFQSPSHFAPNEVLMEGLSLDWSEATAASPAASASLEQPDALAPAAKELDTTLADFMMQVPDASDWNAPVPDDKK